MPAYTQEGRKFRVDTSLGPDVLLLERFTGEEAISTPYAFTLHMVSEDPALNQYFASALLRQPVSVRMELPDGSRRFIHGLCSRVAQGATDGPLTNYQAEVVPWLWFLSLWSDCRVFQKLSVPEIVEQVFKERGFTDYRLALQGSFEPREYCVQYRETHLAFVSRLLEEEGIFYFFEHEADKHTLVLANTKSQVQPCPGQATARMAGQAGPWQHADVVTGLVAERAAHTGKVTLTDYNYLTPSANLEAPVEGRAPEERYDYPGRYDERDDGERYARLLLEAHEAQEFVVRGEGTCRAFLPGYRFELEEHYCDDLNREYQILRVRHEGSSGGFGTDRGDDELDYRNSFECISASVPYRPPRATPRPIVHGSQTAVVVGPGGEEIWTDEHGRIKVQFHWDRLGKKDENSSCWIRVAQPWAGKGWGSLAIPRIGQEVVVEFLEGDPDRPLVMGSVYNAEQTPPYSPKDGGVVSGLRSKTHKKSAGYNEMSMDDTTGKEKVTVHAQYNMDSTVENDETHTVHNNRTVTVDVDHTESVGNNQTMSVGNDQKLEVSNNQDTTIGAKQTLDVGTDQDEVIGAKRTISVGTDDTLDVGTKLAITAGTEITITVGAASITMKADGTIEISGVKIAVDASATLKMQGVAEGSLTVGPSSLKATPANLEISAPMLKSAAMAINEITGATVKLN
jgi:type VI secretion system secreted protein VgrG